jgi:Rrf2 family protein
VILSQTAEYALAAVLLLAEREGWSGVEQIAAELRLPRSYLSKALQTLARRGVLKSARGRNGGFALRVAPESLPLARIIAPFEEHAGRRHCLLGRTMCSDRSPCAAHYGWKGTADHIADFFRTTTVADLRQARLRETPVQG